MADRTLKIAALLEARQSRMTARRVQLPLLATFALIGATAVAIFAPLAAATSQKSQAPAAARPAASSDDARHQALSALVADHDLAARRALEASRELTQEATPAAATVRGELLRPANSSVRSNATRTRTMRMLVTAYCPCTKCCGPSAQGITASGKPVSHNNGRFVAADKSILPFGTKLQIPGYHGAMPVEVLDTGSAIKGHRLDVYFSSHQTALEWGKRWVDVVVAE